ncbi:MAG: PEP-CTERM sorting domain-containing protein [Verrucomicrobiota bacterium]
MYSTSFEDFTPGAMSSGGTTQGGWSGGAQSDFANNDVGDEQIVNTEAHTGSQSWHYARGYNSPGQGTPFTPNLSPSFQNVGDIMTVNLWFKAHTSGDGSLLAIEMGNVAGNDRSEIIAYIDNTASGINIRSFTGGAFISVPIASALDASVWHELSFTMTRTATDNAISVWVDGGTPVEFNGSLDDFREDLAAPYSESSRLKFRTRHADGNLSFNGFYIDDITVAVPEPGSMVLSGLAVIGLAARRRRA